MQGQNVTSDISPGPHGWGVTVLAGPAGRVDVKVLGRSRVHVCALAGGFLQGLAYDAAHDRGAP
jgi:hypothetical protein